MSSGASPPFLSKPHKTWNENFVEYITSVQRTGIDIDNNPSVYVSIDSLARYWEDDGRLQDVIDSSQANPIAADQCRIRQSYLRIWSCLVYIGHPEFITWFIKHIIEDDHMYSVHNLITLLAKGDVAAQEIIRGFHQHHWKFWPVLFEKDNGMFKRTLDPKCVLPIAFEDRLTPTADYCKTIVSKVHIDESCCDFEEVRSFLFARQG